MSPSPNDPGGSGSGNRISTLDLNGLSISTLNTSEKFANKYQPESRYYFCRQVLGLFAEGQSKSGFIKMLSFTCPETWWANFDVNGRGINSNGKNG